MQGIFQLKNLQTTDLVLMYILNCQEIKKKIWTEDIVEDINGISHIITPNVSSLLQHVGAAIL